ncbi:hypothetical protein APY04_0106 [Hyphomicrobium sulfonivorans]|uniref:Uncharacterized protein n=1 Tax=Hyphomicrobium sulfonivorans TaxID=121290 RepID=A0A125NWB9_HYPSL|nr:hypothetical protein APY04_0106 [Hyphomicrobium sulfonivorans]
MKGQPGNARLAFVASYGAVLGTPLGPAPCFAEWKAERPIRPPRTPD